MSAADNDYRSKRDAILNDFKPYTSRADLESSIKQFKNGKVHANFLQLKRDKTVEVIKYIQKLNSDFKITIKDPLFSQNMPSSLLIKQPRTRGTGKAADDISGSSSSSTTTTPGHDLHEYVNNAEKLAKVKQTLDKKKEMKRMQKSEEDKQKAQEEFLLKQQAIQSEIEIEKKKREQEQAKHMKDWEAILNSFRVPCITNIAPMDFDLETGEPTNTETKQPLLLSSITEEAQPGEVGDTAVVVAIATGIDQFLKLCFQDDIASLNEVQSIFTQQCVTYDILSELTDDILKNELKIDKWVHRRKIMKQIAVLPK